MAGIKVPIHSNSAVILNYRISRSSSNAVKTTWKTLSEIHRQFPLESANDRIWKIDRHLATFWSKVKCLVSLRNSVLTVFRQSCHQRLESKSVRWLDDDSQILTLVVVGGRDIWTSQPSTPLILPKPCSCRVWIRVLSPN